MPEINVQSESQHVGPDGSVLPGNPGEEEVLTVRDGQAVVVPRTALAAPPAPAPVAPTPETRSPRPAWLDRGRGEVFNRTAAERAQAVAEAVGADDPVGQDAAALIHEARHDPHSPMFRALNGLDPQHEAEAHERLMAAYRALEPQNQTLIVLDETREETAERVAEEKTQAEQAAFAALTSAPPVRDDGRTFALEAWTPAITLAEQHRLAPAELEGLGHAVLAAEHERQITDADLRQLWGADYDAKDARLADVLEAILKTYPGEQREAVRLALAKKSVVARLDRILDRRAAGTA